VGCQSTDVVFPFVSCIRTQVKCRFWNSVVITSWQNLQMQAKGDCGGGAVGEALTLARQNTKKIKAKRRQ
jgi:hypothetical protein